MFPKLKDLDGFKVTEATFKLIEGKNIIIYLKKLKILGLILYLSCIYQNKIQKNWIDYITI